MKATLLVCAVSLMFCSCATNVGTKFTLPDVDKLQLGKMQASDALALFGKPTATEIKVTPEGKVYE